MARARAPVDRELLDMQEFAVRGSMKLGLTNSLTGAPVRFDTVNSHRGLRVVFRKLGQNEKEHWVNFAACALTSSMGDEPPFGNNCHCEVVMDVAAECTVRIGTMYKYPVRNEETGETEWKPGSLFVSQISSGELSRYETLQLTNTTRAMETRLLCFALLNLNAPFDVFGYRTRAVWPRAVGAVAHYDPVANDVKLQHVEGAVFLCPQLVVLLMQAAAYESTRGARARHSSFVPVGERDATWVDGVEAMDAGAYTPNSLYRALVGMEGVVHVTRPDMTLSRNGRI